jgi:pimeloyl-ACP methyl ester carboxylesterase
VARTRTGPDWFETSSAGQGLAAPPEREEPTVTSTVRSADGTTIAYERAGVGPPLILVGGAFNNRGTAAALASLLAPHLTTFAFDRRGRGGSGDTPPYAPEREVEDLRALVEAAGGSAGVYGHSSGAVLALEAAAARVGIDRLAVYEPPFMVDDSRQKPPPDIAARVQAALDAGQPDEAARIFLTQAVGVSPEVMPMIEQSPDWPGMVGIAHTLPYDLAIVGDASLPVDRLRAVDVPILAMDGGASPDWARNAVAELANALPTAQRVTVPGQDHGVAAEVLAPYLIEFFS